MSDRNKKIRAAIAGVLQLISEEQATPVRAAPIPPNAPVSWSLYGRQAIMINRSQMQRRLSRR